MSQSRRAMVECIFGWGKQHGTMRKTKHRGIAHVAADFLLNLIAYNLIPAAHSQTACSVAVPGGDTALTQKKCLELANTSPET